MSNMIKKSLDPNRQHVSPLDANRTDIGLENLQVRILKYPNEQEFKRMVYKASTATRGNDISDDTFDPVVVEDAFKGGLNQCLEWDTVVFEISGVSRGLTHEIVRSRRASFAQQSMRHTDMGRNFNIRMPQEIAINHNLLLIDPAKYPMLAELQGPSTQSATPAEVWNHAMRLAREAYGWLVEADIPFQDARTVCPIGTETYIIAEYPVSEFIGTYAYRACYMFYPEIVALFHLMKAKLVEQAPWLEPYVVISCEKTQPNNGQLHMCTYQGWEKVEGHCPLAWAKEDNRVWKSRKFEN